jgi:hypothetical protein
LAAVSAFTRSHDYDHSCDIDQFNDEICDIHRSDDGYEKGAGALIPFAKLNDGLRDEETNCATK